ncbi:bacteriocin fulvocin C-related protein [Nocardia brasiliensis]|uniref:bacteriocin fulvocin C-related protein n=1 Tax=Nocardia brasiliensis TaxID=37326 RepID=UPI0032AEB51B
MERRARAIPVSPTTAGTCSSPSAPRALAEFGPAQARRIVGVLGPDTEAGERTLLAKLPDCECSAASSHCGDRRCVGLVNGCNKKGGCGTLWRYECNGRCA